MKAEIIITEQPRSTVGAQIRIGSTTIELGAMNEEERNELAISLMEAARTLGQASEFYYRDWLKNIIRESGCDLAVNAQ